MVFTSLGLPVRVNLYTMSGIIFVFGMYYAPYVYMFTASALRNMDPSLEEAAEISGGCSHWSLPSLPSTVTVRSVIWIFTPAGTCTGFFPIRDIVIRCSDLRLQIANLKFEI